MLTTLTIRLTFSKLRVFSNCSHWVEAFLAWVILQLAQSFIATTTTSVNQCLIPDLQLMLTVTIRYLIVEFLSSHLFYPALQLFSKWFAAPFCMICTLIIVLQSPTIMQGKPQEVLQMFMASPKLSSIKCTPTESADAGCISSRHGHAWRLGLSPIQLEFV